MKDAKTFAFQTEVGQLLDIVAQSLYSNREIFLRELVSNASDACDRLRYESLTKPKLLADGQEFRIELSADSKAKTLSVIDNGIGLSEKDLPETLGTIAKSGTSAFLQSLKDKKADLDLIGQFGVGFYSAFMVAERVDVLTRKAGEKSAWLWSSDGKGAFTVAPAERATRGTTIILHLKKDAHEFLESARLKHIVKTYSDHIGFPVVLGDETLNEASALWTRAPKEIGAEQHAEFYRHCAGAYDEPLMTLHNKVEGIVSYVNLLYVPSMRPFDLFEPERKGQVKLYVNRVFITQDAKGLLPAYLRFLRGIVDSEDLSLNVSREMLQSDPKLAKIKSGLTKRVLGELAKKAEKEPEDYAKFWELFGGVLKEGLVEDADAREKLLPLCRFASSESSGESSGLTSLGDYVSRMREGQEAIYYICGEDADKIANSPHLEGFRSKGIEVLLLSDSVDDFWLQHIAEFDGKSFKSVTRGSADLDAIKDKKPSKKKDDKSPALDALIAALKLELGDSVKDVRASARLTDSPVCLIADDGDMDVNLERLLHRHGHLAGAGSARILELNPSHSIIRKLLKRAKSKEAGKDKILRDSAHLLLAQARLSDGATLADPAEFGRRLNNVLDNVL